MESTMGANGSGYRENWYKTYLNEMRIHYKFEENHGLWPKGAKWLLMNKARVT